MQQIIFNMCIKAECKQNVFGLYSLLFNIFVILQNALNCFRFLLLISFYLHLVLKAAQSKITHPTKAALLL